MSKTIEIKKVHIRNLFLSFILGFGILFGLEHFGQFSYIAPSPTTYDEQGRINMTNYISPQTKVSSIYYETFFKNKITTGGNGFEAVDLAYLDGDFYTYSNKIYYITEALKQDYRCGIYISLSLFLLTIFFSVFKIKIT